MSTTTEQTTARLRQYYREEIVPTMMSEFGYINVMQVPMLT